LYINASCLFPVFFLFRPVSGDPGPAKIQEGINAGQTAHFTVVPGPWNISVKAYMGAVLKAEGSASVYLKAGKNGSINITMGRPDAGTSTVTPPNGEISTEAELAAINDGTTIKDCYCDTDLTLVDTTLSTSTHLTHVGGITNINDGVQPGQTAAILNCLYAGSINVDTSRGTDYANIGSILGLTHSLVTTTINNCAVVSSSIIYKTASSFGTVRRVVGDTSTKT
jgi:hypothetical protein